MLVYFCPSMSDGAAARLSKVLVAAFGALVMGLTWVASMMGGILAAALALFGAIGGPLLGVFTLGIFVPFANSFGAIFGLFTALAVSLWITVGAHIYKVDEVVMVGEDILLLVLRYNVSCLFTFILHNNSTRVW